MTTSDAPTVHLVTSIDDRYGIPTYRCHARWLPGDSWDTKLANVTCAACRVACVTTTPKPRADIDG